MNKYNKDRVAFGYMPKRIQDQIKATPVHLVDVDNPAPMAEDWSGFKKSSNPCWWPRLAYRVRPPVKPVRKARPVKAKAKPATGTSYDIPITIMGHPATLRLPWAAHVALANKFYDESREGGLGG